MANSENALEEILQAMKQRGVDTTPSEEILLATGHLRHRKRDSRSSRATAAQPQASGVATPPAVLNAPAKSLWKTRVVPMAAAAVVVALSFGVQIQTATAALIFYVHSHNQYHLVGPFRYDVACFGILGAFSGVFVLKDAMLSKPHTH